MAGLIKLDLDSVAVIDFNGKTISEDGRKIKVADKPKNKKKKKK